MMCTLTIVVAALLLCFWPTAISAQLRTNHGETATIHLAALDCAGRELGEAKIDSFKQEAGGREFAPVFKRNKAKGIPYGNYRLRVHKTGFWTAVRTVYVYKPDVWIIVGLEFSEEGSVRPSAKWIVSGEVKNIDPSEQPIYVRLVGLYCHYSVEDRIDVSGSSGAFTLAGQNPPGKFLLLTIGRTRILNIRQLDVPAEAPVVIELTNGR